MRSRPIAMALLAAAAVLVTAAVALAFRHDAPAAHLAVGARSATPPPRATKTVPANSRTPTPPTATPTPRPTIAPIATTHKERPAGGARHAALPPAPTKAPRLAPPQAAPTGTPSATASVPLTVASATPQPVAAPRAPAPAPAPTPAQPSPTPGLYTPSATIDIPRLGVQASVYERGIDANGQLPIADGYGVTHYSFSAPLGGRGNYVIYGHDDIQGSIFHYLPNMQVGDPIYLTADGHRYTYRVTGSQVVAPSDVAVMNPTPDATITLISCTPYWVDTQRIVVKGTLSG